MALNSGISVPTLTDIELRGSLRGPDLAAAATARRQQRYPMALAPTFSPDELAATEFGMTWGDFQQRHPDWRGPYWEECRALYAGGPRLLETPKVLERLFPSHMHEVPMVYAARKQRAHYYPYPGTIIDHLLNGLGTDPLKISFDQVDDKGVATKPDNAEWWEHWCSDVTDEAERPSDYGIESKGDDEGDDEGGCTMHHFLVDCLREALQTQTAWVLADLPTLDADDSAVGASSSTVGDDSKPDPYLCLVPTEQVIDWQCDSRGKLLWVLIMNVDQIRATPRQRRGKLHYTFTLWDAETWVRYEIDVDPANPPPEQTVYQPTSGGVHAFGRVPFERLRLPEGLYAMGKLHSLAREHLNKRCAMSWAEYKSLFAILYEFLGNEDGRGLPVPSAQMDENRATNQIRGQGYTQVRGKDDKAMFVGPDPAVFTAARESCNDAMREMHRVMFSMALSANMDSAALQRSADSKSSDNASIAVLLDAFGTLAMKFARRLLLLASLGRGEAVPKASITGLDSFDVDSTASMIEEAVTFLNGIPQRSSTVVELFLSRLYSAVIGDVSQEQMEQIRKEIREHMAEEESIRAAGMMPGQGGMLEDDDGDEQQPGQPGKRPPAPAPGKPTPKGKRVATK